MSTGEMALKTHVAEAFRQITKRVTLPEIHVAFYPFAGLTHTIRIRKQQVYVRVSDILRDAPPPVYRALAFILVAKLFNQRVMTEHLKLYRQYTYQPQVVRASDLARRQRGRKIVSRTPGGVHDLNRIFTRLNRQYFENALSRPQLSWSARRTKRILGHHDAVHDTIVISKSLDREEIPEYVVEYVLYHEMLHIKHPPRIINGRRVHHTAAFRSEEKRFYRYHEALKALDQLSERSSGAKERKGK